MTGTVCHIVLRENENDKVMCGAKSFHHFTIHKGLDSLTSPSGIISDSKGNFTYGEHCYTICKDCSRASIKMLMLENNLVD
jgi:hypothetical protein